MKSNCHETVRVLVRACWVRLLLLEVVHSSGGGRSREQFYRGVRAACRRGLRRVLNLIEYPIDFIEGSDALLLAM
ncbi:hypothetical protein R1flu_020290 [Riccia fluitans]|uniref:Secreted protein n=1 Tax=Riccia fluitans TaxID=41844 RepID=A0ABD1ZM90_9MARC